MAGLGGVIKDNAGAQMQSFSGPVGYCSINKSELETFIIRMNEGPRVKSFTINSQIDHLTQSPKSVLFASHI